jgi:hypothetical protein
MENTDVTRFGDQMAHEEWIKTLNDGRKVKFIYQELPEDGAFITAHLERNEVVYSVVLTNAGTHSVARLLKVISKPNFPRSSNTLFGTHQGMVPRLQFDLIHCENHSTGYGGSTHDNWRTLAGIA